MFLIPGYEFILNKILNKHALKKVYVHQGVPHIVLRHVFIQMQCKMPTEDTGEVLWNLRGRRNFLFSCYNQGSFVEMDISIGS